MRVFLTGSTGFIGSAIVPELIGAGHAVLGLARSEAGAARLAAAGAAVHRGDLEDPDSLTRGAAAADAVIHTAFDHDFARFVENCGKDRRAIRALAAGLRGTDRPLLITSGVALGATEPGKPATEDAFAADHPIPRIASELEGAAMLAEGVNVSVMRLPQVHDPVKQGLVTPLVDLARRTGVSAYLGEGANRWSAAHVSDVARLYRLAIERAEAGRRYNAVAEEGVPVRLIAEALGRGLGLPVRSLSPDEAAGHFGWMAGFAGFDMSASSALTRERTGWHPTGPGLIADLDAMRYDVA